jgi:hypothetical protein
MVYHSKVSEYDTPADHVYKWTIRGLYLAAISINLWFLMEQHKDSPEGQRIVSRMEKFSSKIIKPWHQRKYFRRAVNETIYEAWNVVDTASQGEA